ncbi:hypothetical protein SAMD00019534_111990 [Acytostelium subglobosum LB1]|uniref:hypothetical protein n=1 Tax=Acytostelium subglobosum LB1 TaxID=1410327 RepID=UPI000644F439|nr:hypothetical protein SAMD00019534_111990 [Acytostelium subglobosum LB1]GAM28023.1 hypothetical protein SAMD00019534_111990 [Acytostelium subglobosum LB1]|eukprot:XP_012748982.1 hypothetical protein SAMD00019534_111990 [Acytostelium subglobosum LB1]
MNKGKGKDKDSATNNNRHWCKYCQTFIFPNQSSIKTHETGWFHKNNVRNVLQTQKREKANEEKEKRDHLKEIENLKQAGLAAYKEKDINQQHYDHTATDAAGDQQHQQQQLVMPYPQQFSTMEEYNIAYQQYYYNYYNYYYYGIAPPTAAAPTADQSVSPTTAISTITAAPVASTNKKSQTKQTHNNNNNNNTDAEAKALKQQQIMMNKQLHQQKIQEILKSAQVENDDQGDGLTEEERKIIERKRAEYNERKQRGEIDEDDEVSAEKVSGTHDDDDETSIHESKTNESTGIGGWVSVHSSQSMFGSDRNEEQADNGNGDGDAYDNDRYHHSDEEQYGSSDEETVDMTKRIAFSHGNKSVGADDQPVAAPAAAQPIKINIGLKKEVVGDTVSYTVPKVQFAIKPLRQDIKSKNFRKKDVEL